MTSLTYHFDREQEAKALVEAHHYSHSANGKFMLTCVACDEDDNPVSAALFAHPQGGRYAKGIWELVRLVHDPNKPKTPLTPLIGKACKQAKARGALLMISYASRSEGHHGGVYQAASWRYGGMRPPRIEAFLIDGERTPARTCNDRYGTSSEKELPKRLPFSEVLPVWEMGKHVYWRALNRKGVRLRKVMYLAAEIRGESYIKRRGLDDLPYPKNNADVG